MENVKDDSFDIGIAHYKARDLFSKESEKKVVEAIEKAELNTSGEIRVHIEKKCIKDVLDRATEVFENLKIHKTKLRNGILFYLAVEDRKFAILGDAGINKLVPSNFWDGIKEEMKKYFLDGEFVQGLEIGICMAGEKLKEYFPYTQGDQNELSNQISFG